RGRGNHGRGDDRSRSHPISFRPRRERRVSSIRTLPRSRSSATPAGPMDDAYCSSYLYKLQLQKRPGRTQRNPGRAQVTQRGPERAPWIDTRVGTRGDEGEPLEVVVPAGTMNGERLGVQAPVHELDHRALAVGRQRYLDEARLGRGGEDRALPPPCEGDATRRVDLDVLAEHRLVPGGVDAAAAA